ncbi:hypothetical protein J3A83DRAFT_1661527 [Scleroderma citrinum]
MTSPPCAEISPTMARRNGQISRDRRQLESHPPGDTARPVALLNLATSLRKRYVESGAITDLEEAISLNRSLLELSPADHPPRFLHTFALCLSDRYRELGAISDLNQAIQYGRAAVECQPYTITLYNLGSDLKMRYQTLGAPDDLDEAISMQRSVLEVWPKEHPDRPTLLKSLVSAFSMRFKEQQSSKDLDELISLNCAMLDLHPPGHPDHATSIDSLLLHVRTKLQRLGKTSASAHHEPSNPDHPTSPHSAMSAHDIMICVNALVDEGDEVVGVDEIVNLARASLQLCPPGDTDYIMSLTMLANCLHRRFQERGSISDLDDAIALCRRASDVYPLDNPNRAEPLHTLAQYLSDRFTKLGRTIDLDDVIQCEKAVLQHRPQHHLNYTESILSLSKCRLLRINAPDAFPQYPGGLITNPRIKRLIRGIVCVVLKSFPPRLFNTHTGMLCDRDSQMSSFEKSAEYAEVESSASTLDTIQLNNHIRRVVLTYFRYVMLSHRWGTNEPLLEDIKGRVIYDLNSNGGLWKLQSFCLVSCLHGYMWAWADMCCIDKQSSVEVEKTIESMFSWYRQSALTIVYLSDVSDATPLSSSQWFRRGWTLQELLAPNNIMFFRHDWSPYADSPSNHKNNSTIIRELEQATGITSHHLVNFHPGVEDARSTLWWASTRRTTRPQDVAYSLLAIFDLHMPIMYGESEMDAIGRLLAAVISKSGDTSILDWIGQPSAFHSCFPATLHPYEALPSSQSSWAETSPSYTRNSFTPTSLHLVREMHQALSDLPRTQFTYFNSLVLPCIVHRIQAITVTRVDTNTSTHVHHIQAVGLQPIKIALSERLEDTQMEKVPYVLIRAWDSNLLDPAVETDNASAHRWLTRMNQPFRALLLMALDPIYAGLHRLVALPLILESRQAYWKAKLVH